MDRITKIQFYTLLKKRPYKKLEWPIVKLCAREVLIQQCIENEIRLKVFTVPLKVFPRCVKVDLCRLDCTTCC